MRHIKKGASQKDTCVPQNSKPLRLTPWGMVMVPLVILSTVFALMGLAVWISGTIVFDSPSALLFAGTLAYAATIFWLSRNEIANLRELSAFGETDTLSQLRNRRALHRDIERLSTGEEEVALALIDLDAFKQINDHYGHGVGDELIQSCALMLQTICGKEAHCYRLAGDEFAALMHGRVAGTILEGMCRALIEQMQSPVDMGDLELVIGASIGLARSPPDDRLSSSELLLYLISVTPQIELRETLASSRDLYNRCGEVKLQPSRWVFLVCRRAGPVLSSSSLPS